jgi:hypothetical protein
MSQLTYTQNYQGQNTEKILSSTEKQSLKNAKALNQVWVSSNGGKNWELRIAGEKNVYKLTLTKEEAVKMWRRLSMEKQIESVRRRFDEAEKVPTI